MGLINFFRDNTNEFIGIYCDDDKIFLARLTDKIETAEINFEIDAQSNIPAIEQFAKATADACAKRGWKTARLGICLRDGEATTFQIEFNSVPENEIPDAVKTWALAHVGNTARYTSMKIGDDIWMETLPASIVDEYFSACKKFSMKLCALTAFPQTDSDRAVTPFNRAIFAAEIVQARKAPNILTQQFSAWNFTKISLTAAAIFVLIIAGISAKLSHDYFSALAQLESAQDFLKSQSEFLSLKENLDADVAEMKRLNNLSADQNVNVENFNLLLKIGKIANEQIHLRKMKTTGNFLELGGSAETPDAVKNYLSRLKSSTQKSVKLENSRIDDDKISFTIRVNLQSP